MWFANAYGVCQSVHVVCQLVHTWFIKAAIGVNPTFDGRTHAREAPEGDTIVATKSADTSSLTVCRTSSCKVFLRPPACQTNTDKNRTNTKRERERERERGRARLQQQHWARTHRNICMMSVHPNPTWSTGSIVVSLRGPATISPPCPFVCTPISGAHGQRTGFKDGSCCKL
jgi:hypothetical protein